MSVFGQQSQTLTEMAKQLGHSDHLLKAKYSGSAPMDNSITAESWLPGTTGVHCNVTHGDHWEEVKGDMTEHFHGNKDSTNHGDLTETHNGDVTRNTHGVTTQSFTGPNFDEHLDDFFCATHKDWFSWGFCKMSAYASTLSATGIALGVTGYDSKIIGISVKVNPLAEFAFQNTTFDIRARKWAVKAKEVDVKGLEWNVQLLMQEAGLVRNRANDLFFEIGETKATVGALDAGTTVNLKTVHIPA